MPDAPLQGGFACADLTTFCRLDELGLEVTEQRLVPDLPEPGYATELAMRVARVKQKHEEDRPAQRAKQKQDESFCKAFAEDSESPAGAEVWCEVRAAA